MKDNFKHLLCRILCVVMLVGNVLPVNAAWDGYKAAENEDNIKILADISNIGAIFNAGAVPSRVNVKNGKYSANWKNHTRTSYLSFSNVERDWSDCNEIGFDIYSEVSNGSKIVLVIYTDLNPAPGKTISCFVYEFKLDFKGWKRFEIPMSEFENTNFADWAKVNEVRFAATGWGCTPNETSNLYIGSITGSLGESEDLNVVDMSVAPEDESKVYKGLGSATAVMNFSNNVVGNRKTEKLVVEDRIKTSEEVSVAPISFLENILGFTSKSEDKLLTLTHGNKSITFEAGTSKYASDELDADVVLHNGVFYVPLISMLTAFGIDTEIVDDIIIIGDTKSAELVKSDRSIYNNLKIMLSTREYTDGSIKKTDWDNLKDKWRKYLTGDEVINLNDEGIISKLASIDESCAKSLEMLNKNTDILAVFGSNACVQSADMTRQFSYMYNMAAAYGTYGSKYYKDKSLKKDILFCLDWMYENLYGEDEISGAGWRSTQEWNWWDWFCGTPRYLCDTLMIMEEDLSKEKIKNYLSLYNHLKRTMRTDKNASHAASRVYNGTAAAALQEDEALMQEMISDYNLMLRPANGGNGIQEDGLYKTHDYFAYSTSYGSTSLLDRLTKVQSILSGTAFDFPTPYKYDSCRWMYETFGPIMYNGYMTNALAGREKGDEADWAKYPIGAMLDFIGIFGFDDDLKLKQFIKRNVNDYNINKISSGLEMDQYVKLCNVLADDTILEEPYLNNKIYYTGDMVAHQRDDYGFALSMSSSRISAWESINGVNLSGWYQSDGMLYMYIDSDPDSYGAGYQKGANPYHMPGTTVDTQERIPATIKNAADCLTNQDFVGAAGLDNLYATAAMQLESHHFDNKDAVPTTEGAGGPTPHHESSLMAKKAWFMFDDEVVALGSDINANDGFEVQTIIENRKLSKSEQKANTGGSANKEPYKIVSVMSSADDGNVAANTIDDDYTTRWSAEGDAYVIYELEDAVPVGYVGIAQYNGVEGKQAIFEIETSLDGNTWTKAWEGKASGQTISMEPYDLNGTVAKYVKYSGHGRTNSKWNSVTEVKVFPETADGSMPVDVAVSQDKILGSEKITVDGVVLEKESNYRKSFVNPSWVNIEGIAGYYFPQGGKLEMDKVTNAANFLEMWFSHGISPKQGDYVYVLLPKKTAQETEEYSKSPDIEILANTDKLQAVKEKKLGITGIVFWNSGNLDDITASVPCIVMKRKTESNYQLSVSDPTQLLESGTITIDGEYELAQADERCKISVNDGNTIITVDFLNSKGRTLPITLQAKN